MADQMNVKLTPTGVVHTKRFSWHTACGKDFDLDDSKVSETHDHVTCRKCLSERKYLYVGEIYDFGVLIDRSDEQAEAIDNLREAWEMNADLLPYHYLIKVFVPFQLDKGAFTVIAHLPDDDAAVNFAEMICWWRINLLQGKMPSFTEVVA